MRNPLRTSLLISASVHVVALAGIALFPGNGTKEGPTAPPKSIGMIELVAAPQLSDGKAEAQRDTKPAVAKAFAAVKLPEPMKQPMTPKPEPPKPIPAPVVKVEVKPAPVPDPVIPANVEPSSTPEKQTQAEEQVAVVAAPAGSSSATENHGDGSSAGPGHDAVTSEGQPGGIVKAQPAYRSNPEPVYPASALRRHQAGVVWLTVSVSAKGRAVKVTLKTSSGYSSLDQAALVAVREWEFEPARVNNQPIASEVDVPVRFRLEK